MTTPVKRNAVWIPGDFHREDRTALEAEAIVELSLRARYEHDERFRRDSDRLHHERLCCGDACVQCMAITARLPDYAHTCPRCYYEPTADDWSFCPACGSGLKPLPCSCASFPDEQGKWGESTPACVERRKVNEWVETRIFCPACKHTTRWCGRTYYAVDIWNHWMAGRGKEGDVVGENQPLPCAAPPLDTPE